MSKGFLHLNSDAVPLDGVRHGGFRTELRSFRMAVEAGAGGPRLRRQFLADLADVSLLVAAMRSGDPATRVHWDHFCSDLEDRLFQLSPRFRELLEMNWWEATGEPRDEEFARELPLVQHYLSAREWVIEAGRGDELRDRFRELRSGYAARIAASLNVDLKEVDERLLSKLRGAGGD